MKWLEPWRPVNPSEDLVRELLKELAPGHVLFGKSLTTIGRRDDCDDALFRLDDGTGRVAGVHLTWSGKAESFENCPATTIYETFEHWANTAMLSNNQEFSLD